MHSFLSEVVVRSGFVVNCFNSSNCWRGNGWMFAAAALVEATLPCERCAGSRGCLSQWWSACTRPLALCPGVCSPAPHPSVDRCTDQELGQTFAWIVVEKSDPRKSRCDFPSPPVSYCVIDVESAILVAGGDVVSEQRVAAAVCILCTNSGHWSVYGRAFAHAGVVWQVQEHRVVVVDVPDMDPDHHLRKNMSMSRSFCAHSH